MVREVYLQLTRQGFRDRTIIVVTTLLDAKCYSPRQLTQLYGLRSPAAQVNLRHLKTTLKMEMLTAKTPQMVRKEIWTHLVAYTLLRTLMWEAAVATAHRPFQLSLQGAIQQFNQMLTRFGNYGAIQAQAAVSSSEASKSQATCCLFDPIAPNPG